MQAVPDAQRHYTGDGVKPRLRVTVFSDYICPFCYVGDARLNKLREGTSWTWTCAFSRFIRTTPPKASRWKSWDIHRSGGGAVPTETLYRAAENILGEVSDEEGEA